MVLEVVGGVITPEGQEIPVFRPGQANIIEQIKVVREAAKQGVDILVVACMAITPEYIKTLEDQLIQSTVGVITNVREDHLDVMGPTVYDVAVHLALSLPRGGVAFPTEQRFFPVLDREAQKRGTVLHRVDVDVTPDELMRFSYLEHPENVALALAVAQHFGIDREQALEGMVRFPPDPGFCKSGNWISRECRFGFMMPWRPTIPIQPWPLLRGLPSDVRGNVLCSWSCVPTVPNEPKLVPCGGVSHRLRGSRASTKRGSSGTSPCDGKTTCRRSHSYNSEGGRKPVGCGGGRKPRRSWRRHYRVAGGLSCFIVVHGFPRNH